jgi:hypothetical protein
MPILFIKMNQLDAGSTNDVRPQPVLHGAFAKRTIARLDSKQLLSGNGGCDDATGETSF